MGASRIYVPSTVLDVYLCVCCVCPVLSGCPVVNAFYASFL